MKKVIVVAFGSHGDILPCLDVARQFKYKGHDVVVILNPFFADVAKKSTVDFITVGNEGDILSVFGNPDSSDNRFFMRAIAGAMHKFISDAAPIVSAHNSPGNAILLGSSIVVGLKPVARSLGMSVGLIHFTPKHLGSVHGTKCFAQARHPATTTEAEAGRTLPDREEVAAAHPLQPETYDQADLIIGTFPDWYAAVDGDVAVNLIFTDFPLHDDFAEAALSAELEAFLSAGAAPVGFTPGTANASAREFFAKSVAACTNSGRRAILVSMHGEHVPASLPPHVLHVGYAPFKTLLPRLSAIVHHGGIGTASQAMRAGIPQLIQPLVYDQFDTAVRLSQLGVGLEIAQEDYQPARIAEMLDMLELSASVRSACEGVAMQMSDLGAVQIYDAIVGHFDRAMALP